MLWTLVRKEFLEHVLGLRFITSAVLCVVLVLTSVIVLKGDFTAKKRDFNANQLAYKREAENRRNYMQLEQNGVKVDRPLQRLSIFFCGLDRNPNRTAQVSALFTPVFHGEMDINPVVPLFPVVDLLFVVAIVMSLLALVFSYDAISGEKEQGTLKLLLSYNVPRDKVILAKWLGGYISLVVPLITSVLIACVIIVFSKSVDFRPADWAAFALAFLASLIYIAAMFSIGLFVSSRCARSSTSISILLFIWVIFVLVVPNVSPYIADQVKPIPPVSKLENEIRQKVSNLIGVFFNEWNQYQREHQAELRKPEGWKTAQKWIEKRYQKLKEDMNLVGEKAMKDYERKLRNQIAVAQNISRISPTASYTYAATDLAGTGVENEWRLLDALRRYQRAFREYTHKKTEELKQKGKNVWAGDEYDISDMPYFRYTGLSLSERLAGVLRDIVVLSLFVVLFFMGAFVSFLRADV
ncbi:MAG TPA: DUF3526 domain-containing protein, partial [Candidatus Latescibacteria bacterium]|nr:DUF3526 domain-containing protein [Candidatus Latescibacterota bacterium]